MKAQLLVLDFGSQYTQLIARAARELGVYCEIIPGNLPADKILAKDPKALILSGGPSSVNACNAPLVGPAILRSGLPIFAICYGMQLIAKEFGGEVAGWGRSASGNIVTEINADRSNEKMREFGPAKVEFLSPIGPFAVFDNNEQIFVWMSHGDKVVKVPQDFKIIASSPGSPIAAFGSELLRIYGVQFHPEVHHTPRGKEILRAFLFETAGLKVDWDPSGFIQQTVDKIKKTVGTGNVVCGLSGGVDSTVAAILVGKAIGERLYCIFVDNGLLRENEAEEVYRGLEDLGLQVELVDAKERFLNELKGVTDPEKKRKIIGRVFIEVFEERAQQITDVKYLVQGTLYPDVIESISVVGASATIKSHHNVGGLIDNMKLGLIEPLRELFKDEVRIIGRELDIPEKFIARQPFPGPGLAVRCLGEITPERLAILRKADLIVREEITLAGLDTVLWQGFAVLLPVYSVGVMGDGRTYDQTAVIRLVTSRDGMTADWHLPAEDILRRMSARIVNETEGINRVVLDISTKPPATIEWE